jgi:dipeptidyl aminopeptidase/acylaminoacyl peptidase
MRLSHRLNRAYLILTAVVFACGLLLSGFMPKASAAASGITQANGKLAYVVSISSQPQIFFMNNDGSSKTNVSNNTNNNEDNPAWSPDGTKVAFVTDRDANSEIYLLNADGSNPQRLTTNVGDDLNPAWSPDGTKIAFTSDRDGNNEIYTMNADGSSPQRRTSNSFNDDHAAWSPDGTKIAFDSNRGGNNDAYTMNADGSSVTNLTSNAANDREPAWSPDGTKIAFETSRDGNNEIYTMNANGSSPQRLTNDGGNDFNPAWSPDGTKIAFTSDRDTNDEIYLMATDGTNLQRLTNNAFNDLEPAWQPIPFPATVANADGTSTTTIDAGKNFVSATYTVVDKETLVVNGSIGAVTVQSGGTIKGSGNVLAGLSVQSGGHLAPGNSPGCLSSQGLALASGAIFDAEIGGTTACSGYDRAVVTGTVDLSGASLNVSLYGGFVPAVGQSYTIIDNDASDAVIGTFNTLSEGSNFTVGGVTYAISYTGNDGNDVVLTVKAVASTLTPKAPNTGVASITAHPIRTLLVSTAGAATLFLIGRRLKPQLTK